MIKLGHSSYFYFMFYLYFNLLRLFYLFYKFIFCLPKGVAKDVNQVNEHMKLVYVKPGYRFKKILF